MSAAVAKEQAAGVAWDAGRYVALQAQVSDAQALDVWGLDATWVPGARQAAALQSFAVPSAVCVSSVVPWTSHPHSDPAYKTSLDGSARYNVFDDDCSVNTHQDHKDQGTASHDSGHADKTANNTPDRDDNGCVKDDNDPHTDPPHNAFDNTAPADDRESPLDGTTTHTNPAHNDPHNKPCSVCKPLPR